MKDGFYELNEDSNGQQIIMFPYLGGNGMSLMNIAKDFATRGFNVWVAYPPGHMFLNKYQELVVEHVIKYAKQLSS